MDFDLLWIRSCQKLKSSKVEVVVEVGKILSRPNLKNGSFKQPVKHAKFSRLHNGIVPHIMGWGSIVVRFVNKRTTYSSIACP